jgi:steroid delta-isomerase-like uncharacterized protein
MTASERTCALIAGYYAAFNRGDWPGMLALLAPDVVHDINQGGRETGRERFGEFLARMQRCYREQLEGVVAMASADGRHGAADYLVIGRYLATDDGLPAATGQHYRLPGAATFEIREGLITRVSNHYNLADWLSQVGA